MVAVTSEPRPADGAGRIPAHVRWRSRWGRLGALTVLVLLVSFLLTPTGCYLSRAGWEEAKILSRRQPIASLVRDPATGDTARAKLRLVLAARAFAADSVRLRARKSFTTYAKLDRDTLVLVLSAAYRDQLRFHTWWFPIVGHVPYKGFFDFAAARRAAADFERRGFDVYLRPAAAFSTLGWLNDPLLSTTLESDSLELANTVIHEIAHNTFFAKNQVIFNESFANFVGARGSAWFFRSRGQAAAADEADARWHDEKVLGAFWSGVYHALDSAFTANPGSRAARLAARDSIYVRARAALIHDVGPKLRTIGPRALERVRLDNAALLARRIYRTDLELFDAVYAREGDNLPAAVERIIAIARSDRDAPFDALRRWLAADAAAVRQQAAPRP